MCLIQSVRLLHLWRPGSSHGGAARVSMMVGWLGVRGAVFFALLDAFMA